jgi:hypothetical protein
MLRAAVCATGPTQVDLFGPYRCRNRNNRALSESSTGVTTHDPAGGSLASDWPWQSRCSHGPPSTRCLNITSPTGAILPRECLCHSMTHQRYIAQRERRPPRSRAHWTPAVPSLWVHHRFTGDATSTTRPPAARAQGPTTRFCSPTTSFRTSTTTSAPALCSRMTGNTWKSVAVVWFEELAQHSRFPAGRERDRRRRNGNLTAMGHRWGRRTPQPVLPRCVEARRSAIDLPGWLCRR